ncbi:MAG: hypothetical protein RLN70_06575, partial [Rhodospirillaceae bacterium]
DRIAPFYDALHMTQGFQKSRALDNQLHVRKFVCLLRLNDTRGEASPTGARVLIAFTLPQSPRARRHRVTRVYKYITGGYRT